MNRFQDAFIWGTGSTEFRIKGSIWQEFVFSLFQFFSSEFIRMVPYSQLIRIKKVKFNEYIKTTYVKTCNLIYIFHHAVHCQIKWVIARTAILGIGKFCNRNQIKIADGEFASKRNKRKNNLAKNLNRIMIPILIEGHGLPILNWIKFFFTQYFIDMSLETLTLFDINIYLFLALHSINIWLKKIITFFIRMCRSNFVFFMHIQLHEWLFSETFAWYA